MIEWRFGLAPLTPRDQHARNIVTSLDLREPPEPRRAPVRRCRRPRRSTAKPSVTGPTDHEQDWLRVAELADGLGFEVHV